MIKLTAPDGDPIYIRESTISVLRKAPDRVYARNAHALVTADSCTFGVKETPDQILGKLGGTF